MVEHHQQKEGDSQHIGKDCKLDVADHLTDLVISEIVIKIEILARVRYLYEVTIISIKTYKLSRVFIHWSKESKV